MYILLNIAIFLLAGSLLRIATQRWFSPLRNIPGPWVASLTRVWKLYYAFRGDMEWVNIELHKNYGKFPHIKLCSCSLSAGPIVRIAPNEVSIDDPGESLKIIYGHGTQFTKVRSSSPV